MYSTCNLFPKLSNSDQNFEESSAVSCSFDGSRAFHFQAIACLHHTQFLASAPYLLGILERNGFFLGSYLNIFAFDRLLSAQHLLRNVLRCKRSSRLEALIRFKEVR